MGSTTIRDEFGNTLTLDPQTGNLRIENFLWNTDTLAWEASTLGSGAGEAVSVENFPAVISGANIPVSGTFWQETQPSEISKPVIPLTIALANSGNVKVPSTGKKLRVYSIQFSLSADMADISFRWTSGGSDFMKVVSPKTGGYYGKNTNHRYVEGGTDQSLYCNITGSGTVQTNIDYVEV